MVELRVEILIFQNASQDALVVAKQSKGYQAAYRETCLEGLALAEKRTHETLHLPESR